MAPTSSAVLRQKFRSEVLFPLLDVLPEKWEWAEVNRAEVAARLRTQ